MGASVDALQRAYLRCAETLCGGGSQVRRRFEIALRAEWREATRCVREATCLVRLLRQQGRPEEAAEVDADVAGLLLAQYGVNGLTAVQGGTAR